MKFLDSMNISASALTATRLRMDVISENMANMNTTRGADGEPYRRKYVVFEQRAAGAGRFSAYMNSAGGVGAGVRVTRIGTDETDFKLDYNPGHPDADENGYVRMPNVDLVQEMVDMMSAYRAYEANITALNTFKDMANKTLEIGR